MVLGILERSGSRLTWIFSVWCVNLTDHSPTGLLSQELPHPEAAVVSDESTKDDSPV